MNLAGKLDSLQKAQKAGRACGLTGFENTGFGGLQIRPTNTFEEENQV